MDDNLRQRFEKAWKKRKDNSIRAAGHGFLLNKQNYLKFRLGTTLPTFLQDNFLLFFAVWGEPFNCFDGCFYLAIFIWLACRNISCENTIMILTTDCV